MHQHRYLASTIMERMTTTSNLLEEDLGEEPGELTSMFEAAAVHLRTLTDNVDSDTLLYLYGRYKQATEGPCTTPKPGMFDFRGKQKWDAWKALKDLDKRLAMLEYVQKVQRLDPNWRWTVKEKCKGKEGFGVGVSRMMITEDNDGPVTSVSTWMDAVKDGNITMMKSLSALDHNLVNHSDEMGMNALHWASDRGHPEVVDWLIKEAKVDVNVRDDNGQTPLHYAYACGHQDIISLLLAAGADQSLVDNDGNKPTDLSD